MGLHYWLAQDTIDRKDITRLVSWLHTAPRLTKSRQTSIFENAWSRWVGARYSVFCNSGSSANLLMYYALLRSGRLKNKRVVVPSAGWVTSVAPAIQFGFEPVMCEADRETFGLDLNHLERLLKKHRPATVFLVQVLGVPHKMKELMALKDHYGFFLLEDACAAVGSSYGGRRVGSFGDMAAFSFYFGHQMSTIEGGMVSTSDRKFRDLLLMLRSHGWSRDLNIAEHRRLVRTHHVDDFHRPFVFYEPGFNLRSTDLNAYIGLGQLQKLNGVARRRAENHFQYKAALDGELLCQQPPAGSLVSSIHFAAVARNEAQRRRIVAALGEKGVETRLFTAGNLGRHPFWTSRYGRVGLPMADRIYHGGFFLPNHPRLKKKDIAFISRAVSENL